MKRTTTLITLIGAGAVAGFLTFGGINLAGAQEDPSTTTVPEDTTTTVEDDHCPDRDGDGIADTPAEGAAEEA